jgi:hypothetical protein
MKDMLDEAGIQVAPANKKKIDQAIHETVGVVYKDCPSAWKAVKQQILSDSQRRQELVRKLRDMPL